MLVKVPTEQKSAIESAQPFPATPRTNEKNGGAAAKARLSGSPRRAITNPYWAGEKNTSGIVARLTDMAPLERP
jgi:hypothetical protein